MPLALHEAGMGDERAQHALLCMPASLHFELAARARLWRLLCVHVRHASLDTAYVAACGCSCAYMVIAGRLGSVKHEAALCCVTRVPSL